MKRIVGFIMKIISGAREGSRMEKKGGTGDRMLPLIKVVLAGNSTEVARLLAQPGMDAACRDSDGRTVLHHLVAELVKLPDAEKASPYDGIVLLLARGADINAADKQGNSPLADAVKLGDVKTVEFLLNNGAGANTRNHEGKTPLHEFFAVSGPIYIRHINREVNLAQIEARNAEMLVQGGADVNAVDRSGRTPLAMAVGAGNLKAIEFLLKNGADVNSRDQDGKTPLHMLNAIVGDRSTPGQVTKITETLIRSGADVNALDNKQQTPLFYARLDCMLALIAAGADVNARDAEGKTPIFCIKSQKCLETLIEKGADIQAVDSEGRRYNQ